jgi:hypothetical protein
LHFRTISSLDEAVAQNYDDSGVSDVLGSSKAEEALGPEVPELLRELAEAIDLDTRKAGAHWRAPGGSGEDDGNRHAQPNAEAGRGSPKREVRTTVVDEIQQQLWERPSGGARDRQNQDGEREWDAEKEQEQ